MTEPEVVYCDDYEAITGKERGVVETKVLEAPEQPEPQPSDAQVETA